MAGLNSFFLKSKRFCILESTVDLHPRQISEVKNKYELRVDIQGVPVNMEIKWRLLYRLRSMRHFYMNTIIAVFQFSHLMSKTRAPGLEIFKMRSTIFVFTKLTKIYFKICTNFNLFNKSKLSKFFSSSFKTQERCWPLSFKLVRRLRTASFLHLLCHALNIRN